MGEQQVSVNDATQSTVAARSTYVPTLERTAGQPAPIAANDGLSYMTFDHDGDAGTVQATEDALRLLADAEQQALIQRLEDAPPGPVETQWGTGFRSYEECLAHIRASNLDVPEGGVAVPLHYTALELPTYSIVSSNAIWQDPERAAEAKALGDSENNYGRRCLYFPHVLRDARRIEEYYPDLSPYSPACMDKLGVALAHCDSKCTNFYDAAEVERVFYAEMEALLLEFFPGATDALVYNHDVFDKDYDGDVVEDQANKDPGVNTEYVNLVHNDLNDNSGRVRCRELLTQNLRNFGREQHYTEAQADEKMSRRFLSVNLAKPMETVQQNPFVLCAWPSFADQPYITNYRIYDDRVGETTRFTYRAEHDWYWIPRQKPNEVSMLKCYDSVTDGSMSRWSFHTACTDPSAPADAPCRKNLVVRAYVFF